jgi:hypothetical protein
MVLNTTNTTNLKYAIVKQDYFGHQGALYNGDKVIVKEITSKEIKVTDLGGRIYWLKTEIIEIIE